LLAILVGVGCALAYLDRQARQETPRIEYGEATEELHQLAERVRALDWVGGTPAGEVRAVEACCRALWERRDSIVQQLCTPGLPQCEQIRNDLLDVALLWTDLRLHRAGKDEVPAAHTEALMVLEQAEVLFGRSCVLEWERRSHEDALGLDGPARREALSPRTAWEHYALGRAQLQAGDLEAAAAQFEKALALQPQALWPNALAGKCAYQRGRYEEALLAFTACVVLAPQSGWCYHNRALVYDARGQRDQALRDYERALQLDPRLEMAARNRAVLQDPAGR
jgi:tetratricopeptide (TPR) repeat protein